MSRLLVLLSSLLVMAPSASAQLPAPLTLETEPIYCIALVGVYCPPYRLVGHGGTAPYSYSVVAGSLPPGIDLNGQTGMFLGHPTGAGDFVFTAQVTDSTGAKATRNLTWNVPREQFCGIAPEIGFLAVPVNGGVVTLPVRVSSICGQWMATSNQTWLKVTNGSPVMGNGRVILSVEPNPGDSSRTAIVTISASGIDRTVTITQEGGCMVTPKALRFSAAGETRRLFVVGGSGCVWTPSTTATFLTTAVSLPAAGRGTIDVTAAPNTGAARTATLTVAGTAVAIEQAGACAVSLTPSAISMPATGGAATVTVASQCRWTVAENAAWVKTLQFPRALHLMADPNFTPRIRSAGVNVGSQTLMVTQAASTRSEIERLVGLLYFQLFGRAATSAEIAFWGPQLTADRAAAIAALLTSPETAHRSRYITSLYRGLLNRAPEQGGWLFQRNTLASLDQDGDPATARDALIANFISSEEFRMLFGNPSNEEFIWIVYRQILGREATTPEVAWQASMMRPGSTDPRVILVRNMLLTPEAIQRIESGAVALLIYHALLLREANPAEISAVERSLAEGKTLAQVVGEIAASVEFEALFK